MLGSRKLSQWGDDIVPGIAPAVEGSAAAAAATASAAATRAAIAAASAAAAIGTVLTHFIAVTANNQGSAVVGFVYVQV